MADYDLLVLGTGAVGSAVMHQASLRGLRTLGIDRFPPGHDRGSSHGESRLIRLSYMEHPNYVPMLRRSYELWDALDPTLLHRSGIFYGAPPESETLTGVRLSARQYGLDVREVSPSQFPQYALPDHYASVFEPDGGWLPVEQCVEYQLAAALAAGARHHHGEAILGWEEDAGGVTVRTNAGEYRAARMVIAAGAWSADLLPDLAGFLSVRRKHLHWFECPDTRYQTGFFIEDGDGLFYGFPAKDGWLKLAEHSGGETIADPLEMAAQADPQDSARIESVVDRFLPGVRPLRVKHKTCMYTMTPDHHFVVDRHPLSDKVAFAAGLSGHGFKFAPALGELLLQLVTEGETQLDIEFLGSARLSSASAS